MMKEYWVYVDGIHVATADLPEAVADIVEERLYHDDTVTDIKIQVRLVNEGAE